MTTCPLCWTKKNLTPIHFDEAGEKHPICKRCKLIWASAQSQTSFFSCPLCREKLTKKISVISGKTSIIKLTPEQLEEMVTESERSFQQLSLDEPTLLAIRRVRLKKAETEFEKIQNIVNPIIFYFIGTFFESVLSGQKQIRSLSGFIVPIFCTFYLLHGANAVHSFVFTKHKLLSVFIGALAASIYRVNAVSIPFLLSTPLIFILYKRSDRLLDAKHLLRVR